MYYVALAGAGAVAGAGAAGHTDTPGLKCDENNLSAME